MDGARIQPAVTINAELAEPAEKDRIVVPCFAACCFCVLLMVLAPLFFAAPAFSQALTGAMTGRALDSSGGVLPGVEVAVSSPALIGGARTTFTDAQGAYRVTQLPSGDYRVTFKLSGFKTLNVDAIRLDVGATMTINGALQIDALSEEVTVISDKPVIDLQATTVGVNWGDKQMEDLPYGRGIRGLARLVPGLSPTQFDVGGNTVGGSTTTGARNYGRSGQELIKFDGVVWDQFFGDYNTYEQVQISAAAKGAEAQSPGVTLSFVIKSGSNKLSGMYLAGGPIWPGRRTSARSISPRRKREVRFSSCGAIRCGGAITAPTAGSRTSRT
jgi:hypothetical protein